MVFFTIDVNSLCIGLPNFCWLLKFVVIFTNSDIVQDQIGWSLSYKTEFNTEVSISNFCENRFCYSSIHIRYSLGFGYSSDIYFSLRLSDKVGFWITILNYNC